MSITVTAFLTAALSEIRAVGAGETPTADDMAQALFMFNELLDSLNANDRAVYAETFTDYTLTPNLSPHTIGVGGTFAATARPESIEWWALSLGGSPAVYTEAKRVRPYDWYATRPVPGLSNALPMELYYEKDWPLGKLYFWPIPTTARSVRLWTRTVLAGVTQASNFDLPPGYQEALRLLVAMKCAPGFGVSVSPDTRQMALEARALVWGNNTLVPTLNTRDGGMPSSQGGVYDYQTGRVS